MTVERKFANVFTASSASGNIRVIKFRKGTARRYFRLQPTDAGALVGLGGRLSRRNFPRVATPSRAAIGSAVSIGITVTASAIASILLDHFGLLRFHQHSAGIERLIGAALMIVGVSLIAKY